VKTISQKFRRGDNLPEEYRELLVRMMTIQARIESEYMYYPELTLVVPLNLAPTPEDKVDYADFFSDEVRHASYWKAILKGLGVEVDRGYLERTAMPIYVFSMRDDHPTWVDFAFFSFFADRQGAYMTQEWEDSSYLPLAEVAKGVHEDEVKHASLGVRWLSRICQRPGGPEEAQRALGKWYPAGLDMFGRSESKRQEAYIHWELRRRTNEQMRQDFIKEVNSILAALGLEIPDPKANRRFL
jgi:ring-1,2-phenylacetyl-CoA epoxidase subunit PaaA